MIEVEIKLPVPDRKQLEQRLINAGFAKLHLVKEFDIYFNNPEKDIRERDEALRIRNIKNFATGEQSSVITFKGAKLDNISMTRKELETGIENPRTVEEILVALGYSQRFPVVKSRQYYQRDAVTACVDQVQRLGDFLELEIVVAGADQQDAALEMICAVLSELGYDLNDTTRESYLCMLQKQNKR